MMRSSQRDSDFKILKETTVDVIGQVPFYVLISIIQFCHPYPFHSIEQREPYGASNHVTRSGAVHEDKVVHVVIRFGSRSK